MASLGGMGQPMATFTITHRTDRRERCRSFYRVKIWPDQRALSKARGGPDSLAFWQSDTGRRTRRGWLVGTIHLQAGDGLRLDAIVHESTHAVCAWCQRFRTYREESRCYGTDRLVSRIVLALLKRRMAVFLLGPWAAVNAVIYRQHAEPKRRGVVIHKLHRKRCKLRNC